MPREGVGFAAKHAILMLDGSGSTQANDFSGKPKHLAIAEMVQDLLITFNDSAFEDTFLSVYAFDAYEGSVGSYVPRVSPLLEEYNTQDNTYLDRSNAKMWDPIVNHGWATPIGAALEVAFDKARNWIDKADGNETRRCVIFLLTDGMNTAGPDGLTVREQILEFKRTSSRGTISLATLGYYQFPEGTSPEEDAGRRLLKQLPTGNLSAFESKDVRKIAGYVIQTVQTLQ